MTKIKKADLVEHLVQKMQFTKKQAEDVIDLVTGFITDTIKKGDEFTIAGFGTFLAKPRKGRIGINPKNPTEKVNIPPSIVPRFRPGKALKEAVAVMLTTTE
jgi:DNA-binding protein HU-beta